MTPTQQQIDRDLIPLMGVPNHLIFPLGVDADYQVQKFPKAVQNVAGGWNIATDALTWRKFSPSTSRDDCAEVLAKLTDEQWCQVERVLSTLFWDEPDTISFGRFILTATPAQIAEAVWGATCQ